MSELEDSEPSSSSPKRDIALLFLVTILAVAIISAIAVLLLGFEPIPSLTAVNTIGSLFLSTILAYLYLQMTRTQSTRNYIQNQQKEILMQQKDFLEASYKPSLIVEQWEASKNEVAMIISNVGQGTAEEVSLVIEIERTTVDSYSFANDGPNLKARRGLEKTNPGGGIDANVLENDERSVKLFQDTHAEETRGKPQERIVVPFHSICEYLQLDRPEAVALDVWLVYEDLLGELQEERLWSVALQYEQESSLEELLSKDVIELHRTEHTVAPSSAPDNLHTPGPY